MKTELTLAVAAFGMATFNLSAILTLSTAAVSLTALGQSPSPDAFDPGANDIVHAFAVQPDGKILVGGEFTILGGQERSCIGRLNADGTVDQTFNPGTDQRVICLGVQPDGKILVGGFFDELGGQTRHRIGRLNADGTVDASFNPVGSNVFAVAVQADERLVVGGGFNELGGQPRSHIGRLNADGTVDPSFNPVASGDVFCLALQTDGKILVGGFFERLGGETHNKIGRLNPDGTLDSSFNPGADWSVYSLAAQADGKILVGGDFSTLNGQNRNSIGRLNEDGTLDTSFDPASEKPPFVGFQVTAAVVQADGKIVVAGGFSILGGQSCTNIARLNPDGTADPSFNPGVDRLPYCLALQADGRILVGGDFSTLGGQSRTNIGRLNNTGPAVQALLYDGSTLLWKRGGTAPEVWRTTFENLGASGEWTILGNGTRTSGGWKLTGLALSKTLIFRARGYTVDGFRGGSGGGVVETMLRPALAISDVHYDGHFGFSQQGPAGQMVVIEASPDLQTWTPLLTNTLGGHPLLFTDPQPALMRSRFYRLRSL